MATFQGDLGSFLDPRTITDEPPPGPRRRSRVASRRQPSPQRPQAWPLANTSAQGVEAVEEFLIPSSHGFPVGVATVPTNAGFDRRNARQQQKIVFDKGYLQAPGAHRQNSSHMSPSHSNHQRPLRAHVYAGQSSSRDIVPAPCSPTTLPLVYPTAQVSSPHHESRSDDDDASSCSSIDPASFLANVHIAVSKVVANNKKITNHNGQGHEFVSAHSTSPPGIAALSSVKVSPISRHAELNRLPSSASPTSAYTVFNSELHKDLLPDDDDPFARPEPVVPKHTRPSNTGASSSRPSYEHRRIPHAKATPLRLSPPSLGSKTDLSPPPRPLTPKQLQCPPPRKSSHILHHRRSVSAGGFPLNVRASLSNFTTPEKQKLVDMSGLLSSQTPPFRQRITSDYEDSPSDFSTPRKRTDVDRNELLSSRTPPFRQRIISDSTNIPPITPIQTTSDLIPGISQHFLKKNEWDVKLEILQKAIDSGNFDDMPTLMTWDQDDEEHGLDQQEFEVDPVLFQEPRRSRLPSTPIVLTSSIVYSSSTSLDLAHRSQDPCPPSRTQNLKPIASHQSKSEVVDSKSRVAKQDDVIESQPSRQRSSTLALNLSDGTEPGFGLQVRTIKKSLHTPLLSETVDVAPDNDEVEGLVDAREEDLGAYSITPSSFPSPANHSNSGAKLSLDSSALSRQASKSSRLARSRGVSVTLQLDPACLFDSEKAKGSKLESQLDPFAGMNKKNLKSSGVLDQLNLPHAPTSPLAPLSAGRSAEALSGKLGSGGKSGYALSCAPTAPSTFSVRLKKIGRKLGLSNPPVIGLVSTRRSSTTESYVPRGSSVTGGRPSFQQRSQVPISRHNRVPSVSLDNATEVLANPGICSSTVSFECRTRSVRDSRLNSLSGSIQTRPSISISTKNDVRASSEGVSNEIAKFSKAEQEERFERLLDSNQLDSNIVDDDNDKMELKFESEEERVKVAKVEAEKNRLDVILKNHQAKEKLYLENLARNVKNRNLNLRS